MERDAALLPEGGDPVRGADAGDELRTLMVAYQQGDATAFDELYLRLAPTIRRFLAGLARDAVWVDDLVQDAFLQLHRARRTYNAAYPVRPWAIAIARHVFLMSRRARGRRPDFDEQQSEDLERLHVSGHEHACVVKDRLERALAGLPPQTRRAVVLHHGLGLRFDEVGQALGITPGAAKLRVCRAVRSMRGRFAPSTEGR